MLTSLYCDCLANGDKWLETNHGCVQGYRINVKDELPSIALVCELARREGVDPADPDVKFLAARTIEALDSLFENAEYVSDLSVSFQTRGYAVYLHEDVLYVERVGNT